MCAYVRPQFWITTKPGSWHQRLQLVRRLDKYRVTRHALPSHSGHAPVLLQELQPIEKEKNLLWSSFFVSLEEERESSQKIRGSDKQEGCFPSSLYPTLAYSTFLSLFFFFFFFAQASSFLSTFIQDASRVFGHCHCLLRRAFVANAKHSVPRHSLVGARWSGHAYALEQ